MKIARQLLNEIKQIRSSSNLEVAISTHWNNPTFLFDFVGQGGGCLTQIHSQLRFAKTTEGKPDLVLTEAIRADDRLHDSPSELIANVNYGNVTELLMPYAEWQTNIGLKSGKFTEDDLLDSSWLRTR